MREIKFRAWDKFSKKMILNIEDFWHRTSDEEGDKSCFGDFLKTGLRYEVMQYTGLKDEKGKKIFEGDICERNGHKYKIIFDEGAFGIENSSDVMDHLIAMHHGHALYNYISKLQIIGNIYENPELLKQ